jgi:aldose 1-epimerase
MSTYSTQKYSKDGIEIVKLSQGNKMSLEIAPELGNNLFSFDSQGYQLMERVPFEQFKQRHSFYHGNPILFPFPNRINKGVFQFKGKSYTIKTNLGGHAIHGFVCDKPWKVEKTGASDQDGAWIISSLNAMDHGDIYHQFPFPFVIKVTYRLKDEKLSMETEIQNTGHEDLPYGFGIHPYFHRPDKSRILIPASKRWELDNFIPTGKLLEVEGKYDLRKGAELPNLVLDDVFSELVADSDGLTRCIIYDDETQIQIQSVVEFDARKLPVVVIYTTPLPRKGVCIEPYSCPTDAFNLYERKAKSLEPYSVVLAPGEKVRFEIRMYIIKV